MRSSVWKSTNTWYTLQLYSTLPISAREHRRPEHVRKYRAAAERQKGTGHARQGSIRAPQWKGGGVVFAPVPRDYSFKLNRKEKRAALKSALTSRVNEEKFLVLDELKLDEIKTKNMQNVLDNLKVEKAIVITEGDDKNVILSARNIPNVITASAEMLNVYDIMKYSTVIVTKAAVAKIEEVYA